MEEFDRPQVEEFEVATGDLHFGACLTRFSGEAEPIGVHVVGYLEFDFHRALVKRPRGDAKGFLRIEQIVSWRAEELRVRRPGRHSRRKQ